MESLIYTNDYQFNGGDVEKKQVILDIEDNKIYIEQPIKYKFIDLGLPSGLKW